MNESWKSHVSRCKSQSFSSVVSFRCLLVVVSTIGYSRVIGLQSIFWPSSSSMFVLLGWSLDCSGLVISLVVGSQKNCSFDVVDFVGAASSSHAVFPDGVVVLIIFDDGNKFLLFSFISSSPLKSCWKILKFWSVEEEWVYSLALL